MLRSGGVTSTGVRDVHLEFETDELGGRLYFARFETRRMQAFIDMVELRCWCVWLKRCR